jgi:hypothetical protein
LKIFLNFLTRIKAFAGVVLYLLLFDILDNDGWIITRTSADGEDSRRPCLYKSEVSVTLVLLSALGNMALLLFCSIWDVIPFIRYVWYRYTCQLPKAHKYIEILAFKERALLNC